MLFNEIYGSYYNAVAEILKYAVRGELTQQNIYEITGSKAFSESVLNIPGAMSSGEWPLLTEDLRTPLKHEPKMPLTMLQKRWLKSLLSDPRIRLFDVPEEGLEAKQGLEAKLGVGLEDVEPLYKPGAIVYFDQYADGDPYGDDHYVGVFHTILRALREKRKLQISFTSNKGKSHDWECVPLKLEYSLKDDKFRLIISGDKRDTTINIARISKCSLLDTFELSEAVEKGHEKAHLVMELVDERNALERVMLHFSHLEKETVRLDGDRYLITLQYNQEDEAEILIRVLSFGPMLKVLEPSSFVDQIRDRLERQKRI